MNNAHGSYSPDYDAERVAEAVLAVERYMDAPAGSVGERRLIARRLELEDIEHALVDSNRMPNVARIEKALAKLRARSAAWAEFDADMKASEEEPADMHGVSDTQLWSSRVYGNPLVNAEIERRPHLYRARQAELAGETPQFQSDVAGRSLFSDNPDLRYAYKVAGVTALGLVLAGVVYAVTK